MDVYDIAARLVVDGHIYHMHIHEGALHGRPIDVADMPEDHVFDGQVSTLLQNIHRPQIIDSDEHV